LFPGSIRSLCSLFPDDGFSFLPGISFFLLFQNFESPNFSRTFGLFKKNIFWCARFTVSVKLPKGVWMGKFCLGQVLNWQQQVRACPKGLPHCPSILFYLLFLISPHQGLFLILKNDIKMWRNFFPKN
jgi:hypothetical protein